MRLVLLCTKQALKYMNQVQMKQMANALTSDCEFKGKYAKLKIPSLLISKPKTLNLKNVSILNAVC